MTSAHHHHHPGLTSGHAAIGHGSAHSTSHAHPSSHAATGLLRWVLGFNLFYLVVEVAGGLAFDSLALLADATHMLTDVAGLAIALAGQELSHRPASDKHSFGLVRAEVLAAQGNSVLLLGASAWIFFEALQRLSHPTQVLGQGMMVVACLGLLVNLASAALLHGRRSENVNLAGAFLHMVVDAMSSLGAILAAWAILRWRAYWIDPVASVLIGLAAMWSGWVLLRDTIHILLEGTPRGLEPRRVESAILEVERVSAVHHLHIWHLSSNVPALSAHVVLNEPGSLHDANTLRDRIKQLLASRFEIHHATLEMECHPCPEGQAGTT